MDAFEARQYLGQLGGLVRFPVFLRRQADTCTVGSAALVRATEGGRRGPGGRHQFGDGQPRGQHLGLQIRDVLGVNQWVVDGRDRVLPDQRFCRHFRAEIARARAHVAVGQLEPGAGEGVGERLRILVEAARNRLVNRIHAQREIGRGHDGGDFLRWIVRGRGEALVSGIDRNPLPGARWALHQIPVVAEEHVKVTVVPLSGIRGPGAFDAAAGGIAALAATEAVLPAEAHLFERGRFRFGADQFRVTRAVTFAESVATSNQGHRFLVVHGHTAEGFADVATGGDGVRHAVGAFGIHINQAHLHGGERIFQIAFAAVALVAQPFGFTAPVDVLFRFPDVFASAAEAEGLEAHRFEGAVPGQDHQVGPGELVAILLLDRPEQAACLVEVDVVGPAVERRKTLVAGARAATSVRNAVGARAMPGHADEQAAVMSPVGGPPVLRVGHQRAKIFLDRSQVELLEFLGVVEVLAQRVGLDIVLVQDLKVQLVWPPVAVRLCGNGGPGSVHRAKRAFGFVAHG